MHAAAVADGFLAKEVTFQNIAGPSGGQAVAVQVGSDLSAFYRCAMIGYQDTLYVHSDPIVNSMSTATWWIWTAVDSPASAPNFMWSLNVYIHEAGKAKISNNYNRKETVKTHLLATYTSQITIGC
ncbi:hypothetical protein OSB04_006341 [Centaurea solstitialis]|uniref:Pectinesterase catalytic domain-containing protein n=1 Tax=Centaurea solstitialis TaxID=347529 RepID=A0AA38TVJ8_9ASTR|nr:hypothetical protein OSB04_006341 [Centaurea solstitialis]